MRLFIKTGVERNDEELKASIDMTKTTPSPESKHRYTVNILVERETGKPDVGGAVSNSITPEEVLQCDHLSQTGQDAPIALQRSYTGAHKRGSVHILLSNGQRVVLPHYSKPYPSGESDYQNKRQSKPRDCVNLRPQSPRAAIADDAIRMNTNTREEVDNTTNGDGLEIVWQCRPYQYLAVVARKKSTSSVRLQTALRYVPEVQVPIKEMLENATRRVSRLKLSRKSTVENAKRRELLMSESLLDEESSTSFDDHDDEFDEDVFSESDAGLALLKTLATCAFTSDESAERLRLAQLQSLKQPIYMFRIPSSSSSYNMVEWDVATSVTTVSSSGTTETVEESFTDKSAKTGKGCSCTSSGWFRCGAPIGL
jgi:hypothetical protein